MTCDMALILVIACITVCLKVSVGGSLLLAWFPGQKRASDRSMDTLMSPRNALGKIKTQQKSQNKNPCLHVVLNVEKEPCHPRQRGVWQLCLLSSGM